MFLPKAQKHLLSFTGTRTCFPAAAVINRKPDVCRNLSDPVCEVVKLFRPQLVREGSCLKGRSLSVGRAEPLEPDLQQPEKTLSFCIV